MLQQSAAQQNTGDERTPIVGLLGGDEFTSDAAAFDRLLLQHTKGGSPRVAILPTAAQENPGLAAQHGIDHFTELGAQAYGVMITDLASANDPRFANELRSADLIYLAGGNPLHLRDSLADSLAWSQIVEFAGDGTVVAGSSAGAMVLCERMIFRDEQLDGLGLVEGMVVLPHFERSSESRITELIDSAADGMTILGIDGATGCLRHRERWQVAGDGSVHVIDKTGVERVRSGGTFG